MAYSTMKGLRGSRATLAYLSATVAAIRAGTGSRSVPIHLIGGLSGEMRAGEYVRIRARRLRLRAARLQPVRVPHHPSRRLASAHGAPPRPYGGRSPALRLTAAQAPGPRRIEA